MVAITLLVIVLQNKMYMKVKLYMYHDVLKVYFKQLIVFSEVFIGISGGVYCFSFITFLQILSRIHMHWNIHSLLCWI